MNKSRFLLIIVLFMACVASFAGNTTTTITQVSNSVTLTDDVDYVITSTTPFATAGSVDIRNTEHAVVILSAIKPSKVISSWLGYIYINGERAVDGTNCQVKMYNKGAIIFPYGKDFRPLTCYTGQNYQGTSCNEYTEGSTGGYMKSLNSATLLNAIRSFKLKRGYMVTFALGKSGWGYSRCFIADKEDLEVPAMPANMDVRVSSYRLFKWQNARKAGLASDTGFSSTQALNASWCYSWGVGENRYPDTECVPNHIYENWPSPGDCGRVDYSCHMKTNNEPGNSADDHPQTVSEVLSNWQELMRTGMRLCSETSHDGSMQHLKDFMDSVDARGWRCDIVDLHCYWASGTFNNLTWYSDNYAKGRPIWISEWVWGASWNNNGAFEVSDRGAYQSNWNRTYNGTKPILDVLNSNPRVERYAYWNSEANCSKIYLNGTLSTLGQYYATMNDGLGYNKNNEYVPKVVTIEPKAVSASYNKSTGVCTITWKDYNGDMLDSMVVMRKAPGSSNYVRLATIPLKDQTGKDITYTYTDKPESGAYYYRVDVYPIGNKTRKSSGEASVSVSSSKGSDTFQYGNLSVTNLDAITIDFSMPFAEKAAVFAGPVSNKNNTLYPGDLVTNATANGFTYQIMPWKKQKSSTTTLTKEEQVPFLAMVPGNGTFGDLAYEVGVARINSRDTFDVEFAKPFPEGVVPVVIAELRNPITKNKAASIRMWDITNKGFKTTAIYEAGENTHSSLTIEECYLAIAPGRATIFSVPNDSDVIASDTIDIERITLMDNDSVRIDSVVYTLNNTYHNTYVNTEIYANRASDLLYGTGQRKIIYTTLEGDTLFMQKPLIFANLQTHNYHGAVLLRDVFEFVYAEKTSPNYNQTYASYFKRMVDTSTGASDEPNDAAHGDVLGWIALSNSTSYADCQHQEKTYEIVEIHKDKTGITEIYAPQPSHSAFKMLKDKRFVIVKHGKVYGISGIIEQ